MSLYKSRVFMKSRPKSFPGSSAQKNRSVRSIGAGLNLSLGQVHRILWINTELTVYKRSGVCKCVCVLCICVITGKKRWNLPEWKNEIFFHIYHPIGLKNVSIKYLKLYIIIIKKHQSWIRYEFLGCRKPTTDSSEQAAPWCQGTVSHYRI